MRFLKTFFNQVWSDSPIAPTASLIVWQQYRTFNGSGNFIRRYVNYFAAKGKSLIRRVFIGVDPFLGLCRIPHTLIKNIFN